jgi:hypothetical protein
MKDHIKFLFLSLFLSTFLVSCGSRWTPSPADTDAAQIVEAFGKKLQAVSLLSPNVAEEMTREYAEYVSPDLLRQWISDPALAPGRMVSSPWPDRIEVLSVSKISEGQYSVTGEIIEVTSSELASGGAANKIPVQVVVRWIDGRWWITEFEVDSKASNVEILEEVTRSYLKVLHNGDLGTAYSLLAEAVRSQQSQ